MESPSISKEQLKSKTSIEISYEQHDPPRKFRFDLEVPQLKVAMEVTFNYTNLCLSMDSESVERVKELETFHFMKILESNKHLTSTAVLTLGATCKLNLSPTNTSELLEITFLDEHEQEVADFIHVPEKCIDADLAELLHKEGTFSDATLQCKNGVQFKIHRNILSIRSEFFEKMFKGDTLEPKTQIVQCDYDQDVMSSVVKFIYTGILDVRDIDLAKEVFKAADYYQLPRLKCLCKSAILSATTAKNAISTLVFADSYGPDLDDLKKNVLTIIDWNSDDVVQAEELLTLPGNIPNHVINLVFKAIRNEELIPL